MIDQDQHSDADVLAVARICRILEVDDPPSVAALLNAASNQIERLEKKIETLTARLRAATAGKSKGRKG